MGDEPPLARTVVAVGTHEIRFSRLEELILEAAAQDAIPFPVCIQTGQDEPLNSSDAAIRRVGYLDPIVLERAFSAADVVITHGGPGLVFLARRCGHVPLVVARLSRFDEAVDDHQLAFVATAQEAGYCRGVSSLPELVANLEQSGGTTRTVGVSEDRPSDAVERLGAAVERAVQRRRAGRGGRRP